ncbi:23S rRNA pseudouridine(2604) synthase RluF [Clostridium bowmanii]|uniref:23S rRNA pseudouridine(2604) synthase RluF n=1 Tax=Clostridium bowmanii TaxID=132925 RepID=UPI001C0E6EC5|nr:23S rRNA pseudouridine(2604) synthase RluF [Clostridium bowmanii]MBU3189110.1 23S rRNA pseudouridine(2604) synthase RluF [Clostridium bowmanii]MCA1073790.1 23S rRNA pseudouridine(2604) synthase RluF [Clostridium bowmanii]
MKTLHNEKEKNITQNYENIISKTRLNKFISETGYCSRRMADKLIDAGKVTVNGKIPEMGTQVSAADYIEINRQPLKNKEDFVYLAFNKPVGITCTTEHKINGNIIDYINFPKRIFPIGRLDKASQGLIFLTSDGDIVNKILRSGNNHEKEYVVTVDKPISPAFIKSMANGIPILNTITKNCFVKKEGKCIFRIILTEGLNRQIRRMCEYLGYDVVRLERLRIMNVSIDNLGLGKWRHLTSKELLGINELICDSIKTEDASK